MCGVVVSKEGCAYYRLWMTQSNIRNADRAGSLTVHVDATGFSCGGGGHYIVYDVAQILHGRVRHVIWELGGVVA